MWKNTSLQWRTKTFSWEDNRYGVSSFFIWFCNFEFDFRCFWPTKIVAHLLPSMSFRYVFSGFLCWDTTRLQMVFKTPFTCFSSFYFRQPLLTLSEEWSPPPSIKICTESHKESKIHFKRNLLSNTFLTLLVKQYNFVGGKY